MQGNNNYFGLSGKPGEFCNLFYTPVPISDREVNGWIINIRIEQEVLTKCRKEIP